MWVGLDAPLPPVVGATPYTPPCPSPAAPAGDPEAPVVPPALPSPIASPAAARVALPPGTPAAAATIPYAAPRGAEAALQAHHTQVGPWCGGGLKGGLLMMSEADGGGWGREC